MSIAETLSVAPATTPAVQQPPDKPIQLNHLSFLLDPRIFEHLWRVAKSYSMSSLVPQHFRGKTEDCFVACQLAMRLDVDVFMLMQGLYVVQGRPGMEAKLQIALCNSRGPFSGRIQFRYEGQGKNRQCTAFARDRHTGEIHECTITWAMAEAEGWTKKSGSKWLTMPDQMFAYRSAAWLIRRVCPEVVMGMMTAEECAELSPIDDRPIRQHAEAIPDGSKSDRLAAVLEKPQTAAEEIDAAQVTPPPAPVPDTPQNAMDPLAAIEARIKNLQSASAVNAYLAGLEQDRNAGIDGALDDLQWEQVLAWAETRRKYFARGERSKKQEGLLG